MISKKKLDKILESYIRAKKDSYKFQDTQSIHWDKFYKKNKKFNLKNLINFRKKQSLSKGLDDSSFITDQSKLLSLFRIFKDSFLIKNLPKKNIGNCENAINFLGYWMDLNTIYHLKWFQKIDKYIANNHVILEIGGGFGSLARIILNNKKVKYFLIDLPEANLMSNYYLKSFFPNKKIFNYLELINKKNKININKYDIFILPPRIIEDTNIKFDFIINTRSFMEMRYETINEYFDLIQKKIKLSGYFLNVNNYLKTTTNENILFHKYPYDEFWKTIISEKSFLQNHIHFFLTKRVKLRGNIKKDLKLIENYSKEFEKVFRNRLKRSIKKFLLIFFKKIIKFLFGKKKEQFI